MTRAKTFVRFNAVGASWLLPSLREAPTVAAMTGDIPAILQALTPNPEELMAMPVIEFEEFLEAWAKASALR